MPATVVTTDDLRELKTELLDQIKKMLQEQLGQPVKKWLKSTDVRDLLGISASTLQCIRDSNQLPFTRVGGVIFYDYDDIQEMLRSKQVKIKKPASK